MEQSSFYQLTKVVLSVSHASLHGGWNSRRAFCAHLVSTTKAGVQTLKIPYTKILSTCWNYKAEACLAKAGLAVTHGAGGRGGAPEKAQL